jgi:hypothetical protein
LASLCKFSSALSASAPATSTLELKTQTLTKAKYKELKLCSSLTRAHTRNAATDLIMQEVSRGQEIKTRFETSPCQRSLNSSTTRDHHCNATDVKHPRDARTQTHTESAAPGSPHHALNSLFLYPETSCRPALSLSLAPFLRLSKPVIHQVNKRSRI